jgi:hypothetical protein
MIQQRIDVLNHFFKKVVDNGTYFTCTMEGKREWMYSRKLIEELPLNKLLTLIKNQTK